MMVFVLLKDHFPALASTTILRNHDAKYNSNLRHPLRRESQLPTYTIHHHAQDVMPTLLLFLKMQHGSARQCCQLLIQCFTSSQSFYNFYVFKQPLKFEDFTSNLQLKVGNTDQNLPHHHHSHYHFPFGKVEARTNQRRLIERASI